MKKSDDSSALFPETEKDDDFSEIPEFVVVKDVLDLHGTPVKIIPEMIDEFLNNALELNLPLVQIIHGKGKSRLKHMVLNQLKDDPRVRKYYDAPPQFGGWGRTLVDINIDKKIA